MRILWTYLIRLIILVLALSSCELFETREPEPPDKNKSSFIPPTSASIVVSNFISSVIERNPSNYIACLSDTTQADLFSFTFSPTADIASLYSSVFQSWNTGSERNYFTKLVSATGIDVKPELIFNDPRFDILLPDSAIFITEYSLKIDHDINYISKEFKGTLRFSIYPRTNGLWSIKEWTDIKQTNDSTPSWSLLKAQLSN